MVLLPGAERPGQPLLGYNEPADRRIQASLADEAHTRRYYRHPRHAVEQAIGAKLSREDIEMP
jgi:hypothetical protein